jgi:hypothetical protein
MKQRLQSLLLFLLIMGLMACKKKVVEVEPEIQLLENSSIESPNMDWQFRYLGNVTGNPNECDGAYSLDVHATPPYALKIGCAIVKETNVQSYWFQSVSSPPIPTGKRLVLKAKVRLDDVKGQGIALILRGDRRGQSQAVFYITTENNTLIRGTSDFTEYTLMTEPITGPIDNLSVFLVYLRNTTGTVYFDDITLLAR